MIELLRRMFLVDFWKGLLLTFRISRFFFPRPTAPRTHTKVVDAWTEAGQRLEEESDPPAMDEEEER